MCRHSDRVATPICLLRSSVALVADMAHASQRGLLGELLGNLQARFPMSSWAGVSGDCQAVSTNPSLLFFCDG
jgi:hypothetical protein